MFRIGDVLCRYFVFHQVHVVSNEIERPGWCHTIVEMANERLDSSFKVVVISPVVFGSKYDTVQDPDICPFDFDSEDGGPRAGFNRSEVRKWGHLAVAERCWFLFKRNARYILSSQSGE